MRKFLLVILTLLILVLTFFFIRDGFALGDFKVLGVYDIKSHSEELDRKISEASDLTSIQIKSENDKLTTALVDVDEQKQKYDTILAQTDPNDIEEALKKEQYEIEKLWISVGIYAKEHNVVVNMQITNGTSGISGVKDLNFTVNGTYVGITEFIYDLEDDSELEFKIENFKMLPDKAKSNLVATFSVKDMYVNIDKIQTTSTTEQTANPEGQAENTVDNTNNTADNTNKNTVNQNTVNQ